ncbi:MAG: glycoside hydrolase family 25 protein [Lentimicrobium sp.]
MNPKSRKKRRKIAPVKIYLIAGIFLVIAIAAGPALVRNVVALFRSGFSLSEAEQYHNLKNFGVPIPGGYKVHGIDVSHHQGHIDWVEVDTMNVNGITIDFVFLKATEGITRQDLQFQRNWKKLKEGKILRGAYHFFHPSRDAAKQAENFIKQVKLETGDLPPVLDIEKSNRRSKKEIVEGALEWCRLIEEHYGVKPIIYTSPGFYDKYLADDFEDYPLWIAHYYKDLPRMHHRKWQFWQHTDKAKVNGIKGLVDLNVYNGNLSKLQRMCID